MIFLHKVIAAEILLFVIYFDIIKKEGNIYIKTRRK